MSDLKDLKVAIVHDWLVGGGAEKVVLELHRMFPDAPIYTSYTTNEWRQKLDDKVITGWLQHFGKLRKIMVLPRIWWFGHLDLSGYDLVISSSGNGEAFAVKTDGNTLHVNYCHSPTHYYWRHYDQYMQRPGFGMFNPLVRLALKLLVSPLRKWDYEAAQRADYVIANSSHIQADIQRYYERDSVVIFPPVDTRPFRDFPHQARDGFLVLGRQVPQKQQILAVKACSELSLKLTVAGNGPENTNFRKVAGPTVTFDTQVSDEKVRHYMASAEAFIFCGEDDFGITPVEAMAAGTPVIAYKAGGALDYVKENVTGAFFTEPTIESLTQALQSFNASKYNPSDIKKAAEAYSIDNFHRSLRQFLNKVIQ
jgi:glycosyltransferase involved in cell wall biosynthesis